MTEYITKQGDLWDSIALSQCGDCTAMDKLMLANQQHSDIYVFPAGIKLNIPDVVKKAAVEMPLPPWKQVSG